MWIALVERRLDGLESFMTLVVYIILIYGLTYHALVIMIFSYLNIGKKLMEPTFILHGFVFVPIIYAYQITVTWKLFAFPMITLFAPELSVASRALILITLILLIVNAAIYMILLINAKILYLFINRDKLKQMKNKSS